jgi:hypothetical protein
MKLRKQCRRKRNSKKDTEIMKRNQIEILKMKNTLSQLKKFSNGPK